MSNLWICREECAERPFRLDSAGIEIRTIEELCYYLYHNMDSLDDGVVNEELFSWISKELKLPLLAATLEQEHHQGKTILWCAWFLMREIGMYSQAELEEFRSFCFALENKDEFERQKLKADRLLEGENYTRSIEAYRKLLNIGQEKSQSSILVGDIWHNMGVAHTRLFLFEEAAEYFNKAYEINGRQESLEAYEKAQEMQVQQVEAAMDAEEMGQEWESCLRDLRNDYKKKVM